MSDTTTTLPEAQPGSVLDKLRQVRESTIAEGEPLFIRMMGAYNGAIALRFDYPEGGFAQLRRALGGGRKPGQHRGGPRDDEAELKACASLLIACCTSVVEVQAGVPDIDWPSI